MNAFQMLDDAFGQLNIDNPEITSETLCKHNNTGNDGNKVICLDCGVEITQLETIKNTKFSSSRNRLDPNRCQIRKGDEKTIYKDVEKMNFSEAIVKSANRIFLDTTKGAIYRGNSRKAIIFACIFHAYKLAGTPQSCESLIELFGLDRKVALKGLKHVGLNAPKNSAIRTAHITPQDLVREIMKKFEANKNQIDEVVNLYRKIHNKSSVLNRSRPQSVAAGLTYYYILLKEKNITLKEFTKRVKLSELTIIKITKEIAKVLKNKDII